MVTKAKWKKNDRTYLYLGVGFGAYKAMLAGNFAQSMMPEVDSKEIGMVALCDSKGSIGWVDYSEIEILEIDGQSPADLLS